MNINKSFKFLVRFVHDGYNLFKRYEKSEFKWEQIITAG
jgi:hypothetical protein